VTGSRSASSNRKPARSGTRSSRRQCGCIDVCYQGWSGSLGYLRPKVEGIITMTALAEDPVVPRMTFKYGIDLSKFGCDNPFFKANNASTRQDQQDAVRIPGSLGGKRAIV
jgi:hypothetical protein